MASNRPTKLPNGKYTNVNFTLAKNHTFPPIKVSYTKRDVLLFASSIGVRASDRHLLYEHHARFAPFPTFPINLPWKRTDHEVFDILARSLFSPDAQNVIPGVPPFDAKRSVDGERRIQVLRPLPPSSEGSDLEVRERVLGVYDKGGNMIVETEQALVDARDVGRPFVRITSQVFGIGQGGYGGPRGEVKASVKLPDRAPDATYNITITPELPLLYRLNGDYHALHADEEWAKNAGFKSSIVHGLLTWNTTAYGLVKELGGSEPGSLREFGARYKSIVYPGDELETRMWRVGGEDVVFETRVKSDGRVALSHGFAKVKQVGSSKL